MGVKHTQRDSGNFRDTLAGWLVSGKVKSYHSSALGGMYVPPWYEASGGNINGADPGDDYRYHLFSSPGTFVIPGTKPGSITFDVLLIGGGGAGGACDTSNGSGGGGAGGVVHHSQLDASGTLTVTVGPGAAAPTSNNVVGANGSDSTLVSPTAPWTITAKGGGGGGYYGTVGSPGGSGGGGGGYGLNYSYAHTTASQPTQNPTFAPDPNFNQYGNIGGAPSDDNPGNAGGGGGSGTVGGSHPAAEGGPVASGGGAGQPFTGFPGALPGFTPMPAPWISAVGPTGLYGGGGAGENPYSGGSTAAGGAGGGGSGPAPNAIANTGGGGGGNDPASTASGSGGSGICIIRYKGTA